jgi:hypothetical protein
MGRPQTEHTARHVIARALKNVGAAVTTAGSPSLTPEYLTKLRTTCLRLAAAHLPNATPDEVVRDADRRYRDCLSFLTGSQQS